MTIKQTVEINLNDHIVNLTDEERQNLVRLILASIQGPGCIAEIRKIVNDPGYDD